MTRDQTIPRTLIAGHVTHDRYEGGFVAGGCALYGAAVHNRLAGPTQLATVVGDDFRCGDAIADVDAVIERRGTTTVFANYYPPDSARVQLLESRAPSVMPQRVDEHWLNADLVHLAPVCGEIDLQQWLDAVGDGLVAINIQGWLKHPGSPVDPTDLEQLQRRGVSKPAPRVVEKPWDVSREALQRVDIACLSEEDLIYQDDLLERLVETVPIVALTRGKKGSRIFVDGVPTDVGIVPADVVDPTGAGDVFAAAFCHFVAAGTDPVQAARMGAAASSIVIEDPGPAALDRLGEIQKRRRRVVEKA